MVSAPLLLALAIIAPAFMFASASPRAGTRSQRASADCTPHSTMPPLERYILRSAPKVVAGGRLIKGLYYSKQADGPFDLVAFHIACDRILQPRAFLIADFVARRYFFDGNLDGCADAVGTLSDGEIDPADFHPSTEEADRICDQEAISRLQE